MFQRLSSLFFGAMKDISADPVELKHRVLEADDGDWLLVSLLDGAGSPEASPAEVLLAESPEESISVSSQPSLEDSMHCSLRVPETAPPGGQSGISIRVPRGVACQARALTKVTQMGRVQRAQMWVERGSLGRSRLRRQNCALERAARPGARVRGGFLQQPCRRSLCH
uniref:Tumor protein p53-inducible nuclear protein 2-like n=1 Tax=Scleropages formosus TaxID=113540 RepID=A0A8C9T5D9_SCLFO